MKACLKVMVLNPGCMGRVMVIVDVNFIYNIDTKESKKNRILCTEKAKRGQFIEMIIYPNTIH